MYTICSGHDIIKQPPRESAFLFHFLFFFLCAILQAPLIMGLRPHVWGPPAWMFLHNYASALDTINAKVEFLLWKRIVLCIPCRMCRESGLKFLQQVFVEVGSLGKNADLVYRLHLLVNAKLRDQGLLPGVTNSSIAGNNCPWTKRADGKEVLSRSITKKQLREVWSSTEPSDYHSISVHPTSDVRFWIAAAQFFMFSFYDISTVWNLKTSCSSPGDIVGREFVEVLTRKNAFVSAMEEVRSMKLPRNSGRDFFFASSSSAPPGPEAIRKAFLAAWDCPEIVQWKRECIPTSSNLASPKKKHHHCAKNGLLVRQRAAAKEMFCIRSSFWEHLTPKYPQVRRDWFEIAKKMHVRYLRKKYFLFAASVDEKTFVENILSCDTSVPL